MSISAWTRERLVCPYDHLPLEDAAAALHCANGHVHRVVDGVPVLLRRDVEHPHHVATTALTIAEDQLRPDVPDGAFDPFVREAIAATNGLMYVGLIEGLTEYPIPQLRLPAGGGRTLLDVGCNWGRWTIAAARLGYRAIGVDPSLEGVRAARRAARRLNVDADFIVGDARYLPLADGAVDTVFSYSVLQHLAKADVATALRDVRRVLGPGGRTCIQMPNAWGLRSLFHQARRGFREGERFEVRYWTVDELQRTFEQAIGPSRVTIDGFFSLNPQPAEQHLLPARYRAVVMTSEGLRRIARMLPFLKLVADSLYVEAAKS